MKLSFITHKLLLISLVIALFGAGYRMGEYRTQKELRQKPAYNYTVSNIDEGNTRNIDFALFWETWNALEENYVDKTKLDPKVLYYGAIKGMVSSLGDSYTFFLTPEENQQSKDDLGGKFEGIGAELGLKNNQIVIVTPLKNSPAEKAGVRAGDIILEVDGKSTEGWTLNQAVSEIRGPKGEPVLLTLLRIDEEIEISIKRDQINIPFVELEFEKDVAVIELTRFGDNTNKLWDQTVSAINQRIRQGTVKGVVLDMRGNPGGFLDGAVYIASEFLPQGKIIVKQQYANDTKEEYTVERRGKLLDIPLVVLINEGSASASEIVAGALRDHERATLVGQKTFGKGSVQQALDLSEGAGVHITISKWILPDGEWINDKGIEPSVKVENTVEDGNTLSRESDIQLNRAIELLRK
ncbi:hypothetical protein A3H80_04280 [Candidatus Roizmanbacteria bacterium RIFCSPLOWO2_02_FULL_37_19]|uniref:PDZ domain-containing protein n=1 Tax=Candidatus Roizmanbacteria bacterium RIFCSPHIGHO2_02_FULL_37_24 TaxID=1802037 RepID=A0A1F7GY23_9BACT|nr:MAG: hypothetical protein A3C24_01525 [Candidatus Roizmanbacteria bacterium RIFCSPHIGHO2_02_FULL_37_24]OGK55154.1 MAG: hypothetical protein A3H80_04280 [Candidatus Roizmanbacteria bacterium RIFCSPLOWO2_02_FULL_37_19]